MKKFNKKSVLLSSAVATGLIFAVGNQVKADTTSDTSSSETTTLQIKHNTVTPVKASISPVASVVVTHSVKLLKQVILH